MSTTVLDKLILKGLSEETTEKPVLVWNPNTKRVSWQHNTNAKFPSDTPNTTIAIGGIPVDETLADRTPIDVLTQMLVVYQNPYFSGFIHSMTSTVEVGTTLTGSLTFTWFVINPINVKPNGYFIKDVSANTVLPAIIGSTFNNITMDIATKQLNNNGATQIWRISGLNTKDNVFESQYAIVTAYYYRYFGPVTNTPTNSSEVKAMPKAFQMNNYESFTLNTGITNQKFVVVLPPNRTIQSVVDLDALNAVITASYILVGTINVTDAGGTNRTYNLYQMTNAVPYSVNHRHQIITI